MGKYEGDYYIGLDMGTGSVGWAVTDTDYHILRAKGKDMWGSRMFDEASTAEGRRMNRIARRRLARRKNRIHLLQELFENEINKVDPGFYHRLDESKYYLEDKTGDNEGSKYGLFVKGLDGSSYTDKEYYRDYPTIFHLRKELIESDEPHDVRLVYLALLNIIKHRGHFLNDTLETANNSDFNAAWKEFEDSYRQRIENTMDEDTEDTVNVFKVSSFGDLKDILAANGISKSEILEHVADYLHVTKKEKDKMQLLKLICGLTGKLDDIFGKDIFETADGTVKRALNFRNSSYEEDMAGVTDFLDEESISLILAAKAVHDIVLLDRIMHGEKYLCNARVSTYEQHKEDLCLLKKTIKRLVPSAYNEMFRRMDDGSYSAYVGSVNCDNEDGKIRRYVENHSTKISNNEPDELYANIEKVLAPFKDDADVIEIFRRMGSETFLQKQLTSANGVIPNQVFANEMSAILKNASRYLPFLSEKDKSGISVSDKIMLLLRFHIPYYVGPLGGLNSGSGNKWAVRKSSERVTPWNFEKVIDIEKTQEAFIENLIRHCTYLEGEKVLPKQSLIYEKFMVLNELNNLKISGEPISVSLKQDLYNSLFMTGKPVIAKKVLEYLYTNGIIPEKDEKVLSGIDEGRFHQSLTSIGKFNGIFEPPYLDREHTKLIEDVIRLGTIYGDSKSLFKDIVKRRYGEGSDSVVQLSDKQIQKISGFKFRDWGRFSRAFLELTGASKEDGEIRTIIDTMWETNDNLMQLLSKDKYTYIEEIENAVSRKEKELQDFSFDDLDGIYLSAPVKRMVWQTIRILKEIEDVMGHPPKRVFVETTRSYGKKGNRTKSRKSQLIELYRNAGLKKEQRDWVSELEGRSEQDFKIKKLFLYYCQMGRCMYTNEPIGLERLMDDNLYDIDHIYPRHFVKDDSMENNLVLVKKEVNNHKQDVFPIESEIQTRCYGLWKDLLDKKLIGREKFDRLTRKTEFTLDERVSFVQRQLVETGQGTRAITKVLKQVLPKDSEVVFSKASVVSDFRRNFGLYKGRCVNDLHHAQDAYLNIVVGNVFFTKFTNNPRNFIKKSMEQPGDAHYHYHLDKMFDYEVSHNGKTVWKPDLGNGGTIIEVKKQIGKLTPIITRRSYLASGAITNKDTNFGKQITSGKKTEAYYPLKTSDPRLNDVNKYGGKKGVSTAGYMLIKYMEGAKTVHSIEAIPLPLLHNGILDEKATSEVLSYYEKLISASSKKECSEFKVLCPLIRFNSLMRIDGFYYYIGGKTGNSYYLYNAVPLKLGNQDVFYAAKIDKANKNKDYGEVDDNGNLIITKERNAEFFEMLLERLESNIYKKRKGGLLDTILKNKEYFYGLEAGEQAQVLSEIIASFSSGTQNVNLSMIKGGVNVGTMRLSKHIDGLDECVLINQSITGLFEKSVNLLEL